MFERSNGLDTALYKNIPFLCFQSEAEDATCDSTGNAPGGGHGVSSTAMASRMHDTTATAGVPLPPAKRVCYPPYRSVPTQGYAKTKDPPWLQQRTTYMDASRQAGSVDSVNGRVNDHPLTFRGVRSMKHKNSQHQDGMRRSSSLPTSPADDDATFVALGRNYRSRSRESLVVGGSFPPPGAPLHAKQQPVSADCFADSPVCNANNTDTAACASRNVDPHIPRTLFEALVSPDPPSTSNAKHDCYVRLASVPKLRPVNRYGQLAEPCDRGRSTQLNGLTLTNTVANKARFWEAQSKRTVADISRSGSAPPSMRNAPTNAGKTDACCARVQSFPTRSPSTTSTTKASPLLHAPRLAPATSLPASQPLTTTVRSSVAQDSGNFNAHGRPNTMALNPRSWRSSERSQSPPPVWNSADSLWQSSQPRSPTSSLLLNGRSKNETDEYKVTAHFIIAQTLIVSH